MSMLKAVVDQQPILRHIEGEAPRGIMPAKSISWKWGAMPEKEAVYATVSHYGVIIGDMTYADGQWNGQISCTIRDLTGTNIVVQFATQDGYPDMKSCGNSLWHMFRRQTKRAGFGWKW